MLKIIGLIVVVLVVGAAVYYFGFYKRGKINDRDGDFIPDEIEDAAADVKAAAKEVGNQLGDVGAAAKGKKRQGRKKKK